MAEDIGDCAVLENIVINDLCDMLDDFPTIQKRSFYRVIKKLLHSLTLYCCQLPVCGYNSQKYDINLIKKYVLKENGFTEKKNAGRYVIKKNNSYACIATAEFKFLDATSFLSAGTSYEKFLKAYNTTARKSYFPYEWFDAPSKLNYTTLPEYDKFYSKLKKENTLECEYNEYKRTLEMYEGDIDATLKHLGISCIPNTGSQNYIELEAIWEANGWTTFKEFLIYYNNLDCSPFCEALSEMLEIYKKRGIDLFKSAISLPGAARSLIFSSVADDVKFSLFDDQNKDIHTLFRNNITGGPALTFTRYHEKNKTFLRNDPGKVCKKIMGLDCNALYLWAIEQDMPTGPFIIRRQENNFASEEQPRWIGESEWLEWIAHNEGIRLQTTDNGGQKRIGPFLVDGFCNDTNTIFEYLGCYYHSCKCQQIPDDDDGRKLFYYRRDRTKSRAKILKSMGYFMVEKYECEWFKDKKQNVDVQEYFASKNILSKDNFTSISAIIQLVMSNKLFGAVECDIKVPDKWTKDNTSPWNHFSEMSPLFRTTNVSCDDIGEHMKHFMINNNINTRDRKTLIGGMSAERMLLATPLLRWYIENGLEVTNIYTIIEFTPNRCFKKFVNQVTSDRRAADDNKIPKIYAETSKLIGNSAYGSMLMDVTKHRQMSYVEERFQLSKQVNKRTFRHFNKFDADFYEVEHAKNQIRFKMPIQLGFFILQYAKLRMLDFYYNCLDKYLNRSDFEYISMDTDSGYFALTSNTIEDLVKSSEVDSYNIVKNSCNKLLYQPTLSVPGYWFPRVCCLEHEKFDARTPGLFKTEFEGSAMVSLCSKMYCVKSDSNVKYSCKGISKRHIDEERVFKLYYDVLKTGKSQSGMNTGIKLYNNQVVTYQQERSGFSYCYMKRKVLGDGIRTEPLDIVLKPINS